jgi:small subunit ribosomal protein S20
MPNLQASIKDERKSLRRKETNLRMKRRYKSAIKDFSKNVDAGNVKDSEKSLSKAYKLLDKAAKTKLLKKQAASRKKSRLAKYFNKVVKDTASNVKTT